MPAFNELQAAAGVDFVNELIDTFLEEAPLMLTELRSAHHAGQAEVFQRAAHSLKSNSLTFGALRLAELARELELRGFRPLSAADANTALAAIDQEFVAARAELLLLKQAAHD